MPAEAIHYADLRLRVQVNWAIVRIVKRMITSASIRFLKVRGEVNGVDTLLAR